MVCRPLLAGTASPAQSPSMRMHPPWAHSGMSRFSGVAAPTSSVQQLRVLAQVRGWGGMCGDTTKPTAA